MNRCLPKSMFKLYDIFRNPTIGSDFPTTGYVFPIIGKLRQRFWAFFYTKMEWNMPFFPSKRAKYCIKPDIDFFNLFCHTVVFY